MLTATYESSLAYWSDELAVMFRPKRTYRRLAPEVATEVNSNAFWCALKRPIFAAFMIGAFTSFTTSGQLIALLVVDAQVEFDTAAARRFIEPQHVTGS